MNEDTTIAIVGMGLALPRASSPEELWSLLTRGEPIYSGQPDTIGFDDFTSEDPDCVVSSTSRRFGALADLAGHPRLRHETSAGTAPVSLSTRWLRHSLLQAVNTTTVRPRDRCHFTVGVGATSMLNLEEALVVETAAHQLAELAFGGDPDGPRRVREILLRRYPHAGPHPQRFLP
ncbi:beta-ketoacyl synthase N-terminal-like domain-containing protein, partial [Saccharomonospora sp. NPDC046836]|uniref:beta-ketoacyl synthase N-terminal-like domain-containing protein n=1 Tax=Saccharomonospora sp. NPDC046836 TaxID=3156921 RepID=UPI0033E5E26B